MQFLFTAVVFLFLFINVCTLENGLARTPPMGWMSWGYYECATKCVNKTDKCLNEQLILSVVDEFYKNGYQEAGYEYIIIDDCWSKRYRDQYSRLVPDPIRFPRGMKFIADYIHARGLKFGMYTNIADVTCMHFPGSKGFFKKDAKQFAAWDVDYIKVDGCFVKVDYLDTAYTKLGHYLNISGRPMVYSCSWPYYKKFIHNQVIDYSKIVPACNMWRNYHDIQFKYGWKAVESIIKYYVEEYPIIHKYHGPGHWNDPDMLAIGTNILSHGESRIQMAVYAMMSAPLILSCDMTKINKFERQLLQNLELIAIAQDPLGIMAKPYRLLREVTLWVKPHLPMKGDQFYTYSFAVVNFDSTEQVVSFKPRQYGLNSTDSYNVMDVFSGEFVRNVSLEDTVKLFVAPHDVILYKMYPL